MSTKEDQILAHITEIRVCLTRIEGDIERNTDDLEEHIKRTNILDSKLKKMETLLYVGAGIGLALYGPQFLKLVGIML